MHRLILSTLALLAVATLPAALGGGGKSQGAKAEAIKRDLKRMAGTWEVVFRGRDGREFKLPGREQPERITRRADGSYKWEGDSKWTPASWTRIDPAARPKTMTSYNSGGQAAESIYDFLNDDELQICTAPQGHPRPTDFTFHPGSSQILTVYRRVKDKK
jgi:uncharacterized protein (TIGR03067 family)